MKIEKIKAQLLAGIQESTSKSDSKRIDFEKEESEIFLIKDRTIYFLDDGEITKIIYNRHNIFCLGFGWNKFGRWYYQVLYGRHIKFAEKLYNHLVLSLQGHDLELEILGREFKFEQEVSSKKRS